MAYQAKRFCKEDSVWMYGVAILMLVFHHLYCDPARLHFDYFTIIPSSICVGIAVFCHLCVAIYSYITGYGFSVKFAVLGETGMARIMRLYKIIIWSLFKFLIKYWMVFAVFVPIGIALGQINFNFAAFVKSVIGVSNVYNNEWWYVKQYIKMLILLPLLDCIYEQIKQSVKKKNYFAFAVSIGGVIFALNVPVIRNILLNIAAHIGMFTMVMAIGYFFAKFRVHEKAYDIFDRAGYLPYINFAFVIIIRSFISVKPTDTQIDWVLAPCFIISISYIIKNIPLTCKNVLGFLGKYSVYIWLMHTFFMYYYFQRFIMLPRELFLIFIFVLVICAGVGIFLDYFAEKITRIWSLIF